MSGNSNTKNILSALLSKTVQNVIISNPDIVKGSQPFYKSFDESAVLFVDVSGFTKLTEFVAKYGDNGINSLATNLNEYMSSIVQEIHNMGGDILKFAGDALLCAWDTSLLNDKENNNTKYSDLLTCAIKTALNIQNNCGDFVCDLKSLMDDNSCNKKKNKKSKNNDIRLKVKVGVGCGVFNLFIIGGYNEQWKVIVNGMFCNSIPFQ